MKYYFRKKNHNIIVHRNDIFARGEISEIENAANANLNMYQ